MIVPCSRMVALMSGLMLVVLMGAGCGTVASIEKSNARNIDLSSCETIRIEVMSQVAGRERDVQMIEGLTVARLASLGLFQRVTAASRAPGENTSLVLKATIVDMRDVTPTDRQYYGRAAGDACLRLHVQVVAGAKTLDEFFVAGVSFSSTILGPSTDNAIDLSVNKIVEYVTAAKSR